jgi:hypothetical protein
VPSHRFVAADPKTSMPVGITAGHVRQTLGTNPHQSGLARAAVGAFASPDPCGSSHGRPACSGLQSNGRWAESFSVDMLGIAKSAMSSFAFRQFH